MGVCHCPRCIERRKRKLESDVKAVEVINQYALVQDAKEKETLYERLRSLILSAL
jgi:hypothetical protein